MITTPLFLSWPARGVFAGIVGTLLVWSFSSIAWGYRARISAFSGLSGLLCITVLSNLGFLLFAHVNKLPLESASESIQSNYIPYYTALLILFVSALYYFWAKENSSSK